MFTLKIDLGNALMSTPLDVARALRTIADDVEKIRTRRCKRADACDTEHADESVRIMDGNGNSVGEWRYNA